MTPVELSDWKAEHVRLSLFSADAWPGDAQTIFKNVVDAEPESIVHKPAAGESSATGVLDGVSLEVRHAFNRVDMFLKPVVPEVPQFPLLQNIDAHLRVLIERASIIFENNNNIIRVALGANALLEVSGPAEAYSRVSEFTDLRVKYETHRDLNFQVNTPQQSSVCQELDINRLTIWNCPTIGVLIPDASGDLSSRAVFTGCLSDMNTDGRRKIPIASIHLKSLFNELLLQMASVYRNGIAV